VNRTLEPLDLFDFMISAYFMIIIHVRNKYNTFIICI